VQYNKETRMERFWEYLSTDHFRISDASFSTSLHFMMSGEPLPNGPSSTFHASDERILVGSIDYLEYMLNKKLYLLGVEGTPLHRFCSQGGEIDTCMHEEIMMFIHYSWEVEFC
jgi:hypothetical protein